MLRLGIVDAKELRAAFDQLGSGSAKLRRGSTNLGPLSPDLGPTFASVPAGIGKTLPDLATNGLDSARCRD